MQLEILFTDIGGQGVHWRRRPSRWPQFRRAARCHLPPIPAAACAAAGPMPRWWSATAPLTVPPIIPSAGSAFVMHPKFGRLIAPGCGRRRSWYLEPGQSVSLEEHREFCASRLAAYKHPRELVLVDDLPRTEATGKVQRARLLAKVSA